MLALIEINAWHWAGFIIAVLIFLALDLGVFHKQAQVINVREALIWTVTWFVLALLFAGGLFWLVGRNDATEFITGYIIELSLSMDNVFAIAVIFAYFRVPQEYQHRVLFWGVIGALLMRGVMIGVGVALIAKFHWLLYAMGVLLVYLGAKMMFFDEADENPEKKWVIRLARKFFPVTPEFEGQRFITTMNGRAAVTPLALVLLTVEATDLTFAFDSIPAIFAVTEDPFIIFTSNVFAIMGLRSLYFVLVSAIGYFRYLKAGLSIVLVFVGVKMLVPLARQYVTGMSGFHISTELSLTIVVGIILVSIAASVIATKFGRAPEKKE